jgi:putative ABC transport system permease protein
MWRHFFFTALRQLTKNKVQSAVNVSGLALGLACATLIFLWIKRELSVDQFHARKDRIYRVLEHQTYSARDIFTTSSTPGPMAAALKASFPEVEDYTRLSWSDDLLLRAGEEKYMQTGNYADPSFFSIFSFDFQEGDPRNALERPGLVVLTRSVADKLFGPGPALGRSLRVNEQEEYQVSGVIADPPDHSTLKFDFMMPAEEYIRRNEFLSEWENNSIRTYLLLAPDVDVAAFRGKMEGYLVENSNQKNVRLDLQSLKDVYLRTDYRDGKYQGGGRIRYVRMFALIALLILFIACVNFMNLSTARSATRAREVGVRRVSGATRERLVAQFLGESYMTIAVAALLALAVAQMALPWFNQLFSIEMSMRLLGPGDWLLLASGIGLAGLLAGSYPALFLSSYQPVKVFKGVLKTGAGAIWLRKGLVVAQFAIAAILIISTLVIYRQMNFIREKHLGFDKENLLYMPVNGRLWEAYEPVRAELKALPGVTSVSASNGLVYSWGNNTSSVHWPNKNPEESILFQTIPVEYDFLETIGARLAEGRDFSPQFPADSSNFIINEKAALLMGLEQPLGERIRVWNTEGVIVGVVRDFNVTSLHNGQDPVILLLRPWKNYIYVRLRPGDPTEALASIEQVTRRHNPAYPFEYKFVDEAYDQLYRGEERVGVLSRLFAFLSVFICCLGLFGLSSFATEQRTKEIGIRKVLGASIVQLSVSLSREFLLMVLLSFLIAAPLAYYLMRNWLGDFAYRVPLSWELFALAGALGLVIAMLTMSFHTLRAAMSNPVEALRSE